MSLKHLGFQGTGLLAKRGFLALSFLAVAREMGPGAFGDFSYVSTWLFVSSLLLGLGLAPVTTREIARYPEMAHKILRSSLSIRIALALAGILLLNFMFGWTPIGKPAIRGYAFLASLCLPPLAFADQMSAYALGFDAHHQFAIINGTVWGVYLISTVLGLFWRHGLVGVFEFQVVSAWIAVFICGLLLRRDLIQTTTVPNSWSTSLFLLREAIPLIITSVLGILSFRIGTFLLYRFSGATQTGLYVSALQVVEGIQLIAMAVTGAKFPLICRVVSDGPRLNDIFEKLFLTLAFLSFCLATTLSVVGNRLMAFIFGHSFSSAGNLLAILIWTSVPMFLHYGLTFVLIATNRQRVFIFETLVYLSVSVSANLFLIRRLGVKGAVYAAILSEATLLLMHLFFIASRVNVRRVLAWASVPLSVSAIVLYSGVVWDRDINASLMHMLVFCVASLGLFGAGYWFYRRSATQPRTAIVSPAI